MSISVLVPFALVVVMVVPAITCTVPVPLTSLPASAPAPVVGRSPPALSTVPLLAITIWPLAPVLAVRRSMKPVPLAVMPWLTVRLPPCVVSVMLPLLSVVERPTVF